MPIIQRPNRTRTETKQERKPSGTEEDIKRYNTTYWRKIRKQVLLNEPLCRQCAKMGRVTAATVVDHIARARIDSSQFLDLNNLQPLCDSCHNRKSAKERHENKSK